MTSANIFYPFLVIDWHTYATYQYNQISACEPTPLPLRMWASYIDVPVPGPVPVTTCRIYGLIVGSLMIFQSVLLFLETAIQCLYVKRSKFAQPADTQNILSS